MIKSIYKSILSEKVRNNIRIYALKLKYPLYLGSNYDCNCCGKSFRKFLSKGNTPRANAKCPYCSSLERVRVLDLYLEREMKISERVGLKILHFAPEEILAKKLSALKNVEYVDGDIHPAYATHVIDVTDIKYPENYFDLVICSHVLGHVPDEAKAISELRRVLKPSGDAIVMTLLDLKAAKTFEDKEIVTPQDRLKNYGEHDLCRLHGNDFALRLEMQGFSVERIDYRLQLPKEIQDRNSLGDGQREVIFICKK